MTVAGDGRRRRIRRTTYLPSSRLPLARRFAGLKRRRQPVLQLSYTAADAGVVRPDA
jgi:hypothetical protein